MQKISHAFLTHASDVIAETQEGMTGSQILKFFVSKSVDYETDVPHTKSLFGQNKRTAFLENLTVFTPEQQFAIIDELTQESERPEMKKLRQKLFAQYKDFAGKDVVAVSDLVEETNHWLKGFPDAHKQYESALEKYHAKIYERNMLDDLRLSLELFLRQVLGNAKSLENQIDSVGKYQNARGMSRDITNMFIKLLEYYGKYQNEYVKHNDKVNIKEADFIFDLTATFMRHFK